MSSDLPLLEYWFLALREPVGIIVLTNDRQLLMNRLYAARREYAGSELDDLSICTSPTSDQELWIVHKVVRVENAEG